LSDAQKRCPARLPAGRPAVLRLRDRGTGARRSPSQPHRSGWERKTVLEPAAKLHPQLTLDLAGGKNAV